MENTFLRVSQLDSLGRVFWCIYNLYRIFNFDTKTAYPIPVTIGEIALSTGLGKTTVRRAIQHLSADDYIGVWELEEQHRAYSAGWQQRGAFEALLIFHGTPAFYDNGYFVGYRLMSWENPLERGKGSIRNYHLKLTANHYEHLHNEPETDSMFGDLYIHLAENHFKDE